MIQVNVRLRPEVADSLGRGSQATHEAQELLAQAARMGVSLEPAHPGVTDSPLALDFVSRAPDAEAAEQVRAAFSALPGVDGAWIKPPEEPAG